MQSFNFSTPVAMKALVAALCAAGLLLAAGCNTTEGVGEDIEAAGEAIEDEAQDARGY